MGFIQQILGSLGQVKLTLQQWLLLLLAGLVAVLALLLKAKETQLRSTQVALLQSHFDVENLQYQATLKVAEQRKQDAKDKFASSLGAYHDALARASAPKKP